MLGILICLFWAWICAPLIGKISGNVSLVQGVLYGWLVTFVWVAIETNDKAKSPVEPESAPSKQEEK